MACLGVLIGFVSYEMVHSSLSFWATALFGLLGGTLLFAVPVVRPRKPEQEAVSPQYHAVEDRLDELERLKRRDIVTPEEYAAKRQEILKGLYIYK